MQTLEGELEVEIPRIGEAAEPFVLKLFPCSTVESLFVRAGLGTLSKSTAAHLRGSCASASSGTSAGDRCEVQLAALFVDAVFLCLRPDGPREGVLVAWGFTGAGERVRLSVMPGMRESHQDWLELGRGLIARGLGAPLLVVADGAPGLIKAVEQCWPASDRQRCARSPPAQPAGQAARTGTRARASGLLAGAR